MKFYIDFKDLPFQPDIFQVIYVENEYNLEANQYIRDNYDDICDEFHCLGYEFCYLPLLSQKLIAKQVADYYAPYNNGVSDVTISSDLFLNFMFRPENRTQIPASLLYWDLDCMRSNNGEGIVQYRGVSFDECIGLDAKAIANEVFNDIYRVVARKNRSECSDDDGIRTREGDSPCFDFETERLLDELRGIVAKLQQRGVAAYILEQMVNQPAKLSRMLITPDYRIFLPDYKNMEIEMTPLVKAVYLLFLNHPEGIIFKSLPDYYDELFAIYMRMRRFGQTSRAEQSIRDITDPLSNSINEKCARIRAAFVSKFDERLARHYIIQGERGEAKQILLSQDLIIREDRQRGRGGLNPILEHIMHFDKISAVEMLEKMDGNNEDDII